MTWHPVDFTAAAQAGKLFIHMIILNRRRSFAGWQLLLWVIFFSITIGSAGFAAVNGSGENTTLWQIGRADHGISEFALAPHDYGDFLQHFGSPDRAFYVGLSTTGADWPYVLPGPVDSWAGSHYNARTHNEWDQLNALPIGFVLERTSAQGQCALVIDFCDVHPTNPPRLRATINGAIFENQLKAGGSEDSINGDFSGAQAQTIRIDFPSSLLRPGYNQITLRSTSGSWCIFDDLRLETPAAVELAPPAQTVVRNISAAPYAVSSDPKTPATVRVEVYRQKIAGNLQIQIGDQPPVERALQPGLQILEVPSPASPTGARTEIRVSEYGHLLSSKTIALSAAPPATPADYVDVFMGTAHSRWMIAPGPWMPNSMVKISPDNQRASWCAGYEYSHEYIDCFSHIHEWTMAGLGMMPTVGPLRTHAGLDGAGYSSRFDKSSEHGGIGYYTVLLKDSGIKVDLTATTRASLQRYTFPASDQARVVMPFLLPNEYSMYVMSATVRRSGNDEIEGDIQTYLPDIYGCDQHYDLHFVTQFSKPFKEFGGWENISDPAITIPRGYTQPPEVSKGWHGGKIFSDARVLNLSGDCGAFVRFKTTAGEQIEVRTGISLVSTANARLNLKHELAKPFGWDFAAVVQNQRNVWNNIFHRVEIQTPDARQKTRFYTNLYRALSGRNQFSDVNGQWIDPVGRVQRLPNPDGVMLSSDALWNTFWNLNQVMNLIAPEWSKRWTNTELQLYDTCGWLSKGPTGLKYISVMVAEHEIPLMVAACQAGIKGLDAQKILAAAVKMQTTLPRYFPDGGHVGNKNLAGYLKYHYVPADGPLKGHTSNTFEYAYDDWTVGQLALSLNQKELAREFLTRSRNWRNAFDAKTGFARPRKTNGDWLTPFNPYRTPGFVEGNAWQYTWFVPQDVPGLIAAMGRDRFISRLNEAFEKSAPTRFNASGGNNGEYPINQGNEPTMQVSWLFNWANQPWLSQKWTHAILDSYYGFNPADAYLGDEDQGQMSAWFVMSSIGLFQTDGGCRVHPIYEIGSPLYPKIVLHLSKEYFGGKTFTIEAHNASAANRYIQSATLDGKPMNQWWIPRKNILAGGTLVLELGPTPNKLWAAQSPVPGD